MATIFLTLAEFRGTAVFSGSDTYVLRDSATALAGISLADISAMAAAPISAIDATDNALILDAARYAALQATTVALTGADTITLLDTAANLRALSEVQIAAMAGRGVDQIDATDDRLSLTLAQAQALGSVGLATADLVTLGDTPGALASLSGTAIAALVAAGLDGIEAIHGDLTLDAAQVTALGGTPLLIDYAQWRDGTTALDGVALGFVRAVMAVPADANFAALDGDGAIERYWVTDSASAIGSAFGTLNGAAKLVGISPIDNATLAVTYAQWLANGVALGKLPSGYTLTVSDVTVSGSAAVATNSHVLGFTLNDSATNVAAAFGTLDAMANLTAIALTDVAALPLTYAQFTSNLSALSLLPDTQTLTVSQVAVANIASVAGDTRVVGLSVLDSAAAIAGALEELAVVSGLTSIALTVTAPLALSHERMVANASTLALLPADYQLVVSAVPLVDVVAIQGSDRVTSFTAIGGSAEVAAMLGSLIGASKLSAIALNDGEPLPVTLADLTTAAAVLAKLPVGYTLAVSGAASSNAAALQANGNVQSFAIIDSSSNVANALTTLAGASKLTSVSLTDLTPLTITATQLVTAASVFAKLPTEYTLAVSGVLAADAQTTQNNDHVSSFTVRDSAANIVGALSALNGFSGLSSIGLVSGSLLSISYSQYATESRAIGLLESGISIAVSSASLEAVEALQANAKVSQFGISASSMEIAAALGDLAAATKLNAIALTDTATLAVTQLQFSNATAVLALLPSDYLVSVSGALASGAAGLQANIHVASFAVNDSAAAIGAHFTALSSSGKLSGIQLTDLNPIAITQAQLFAGAAVLAQLPGDATLTVTAATAAGATAVQTNARVTGFTVSDTAAAIAASFDALATTSKLNDLTVTDSAPLTLTQAQIQGGSAALALIDAGVTLVMRSPTATLGATVEELGVLIELGVDRLTGPAGSLAVNVAQFTGRGSLTFIGSDSVTMADTGTTFGALTSTQFGALAAQGIDRIDATDGELAIPYSHLLMGTVSLLQAGDVRVLGDTGAGISALGNGQLLNIRNLGVSRIDATDDRLELTFSKISAIGSVPFTASDTVLVVDTAANLNNRDLRGFAVDGAVIEDSAGAQRVIGSSGDDVFYVDTQSDVLFESVGGGTDRIISSVSFYLYQNVENLSLRLGSGDIFGVGNASDNVLAGNEGANLLIGWDGNDTLSGDSGGDALYGVEGDDLLDGGAGVDYLAAGNGNDTLSGGDQADALYGEDGSDSIVGGADFNTDILVAGAGNDTLDGASALGDYDLMDGGDGNDLYLVDTPADLTFEAVGGGTDGVIATINGGGYYLYANVENLTLAGATPFGVGNDLANLLTGSASANWLLGGAGNDTISGKGGNDVLFGEAGSDIFVFERGGGQDVVGDFAVGSDRLDLRGLGFTSFAAVQAAAVEFGGTSAIDLGQGDVVVLNGVTKAALTSVDFILS